ncbi:MAG: DHA2 family efflux MFS transporter permease subunit [Candidatus Dormibacteria bacterium]
MIGSVRSGPSRPPGALGGVAGSAASSRMRPLLLLTLVLGAFLGMVDATVVAVALDPLGRHFGVSLAAAQEVLAVYLVTVTAALPTLGRLGDRFGRRGSYAAGFAVFGVGSVLAALAPSFGVLLAGRALQAVGGGLLTAGSLALIAQHAPRGRTGRSVALLVITQAVAGLLGPPLGGLLVAGFGWQAVFWAGLPFAVAGVVLAATVLPPSRRGKSVSIDAPGAIALALLLLGLGAGVSALGGPLPGGITAGEAFAVAALSLLVLLVVEPRARHPLVDRALFRGGSFAGGSLATFLSTGTLMSTFALLPFWLENAHRASPTLAGVAFLPIGIGIAVTSRRGGRGGDTGATRRVTAMGMVVAAIGMGLASAAALTRFWPLLSLGLFVLGCGNGLFSAPNTSAAMRSAPRSALGSASGFLSAARNAGVIVGLGVTGATYTALSRHAGLTGADRAASLVFGAAGLLCLLVAVITFRTYSFAGQGEGAPARPAQAPGASA